MQIDAAATFLALQSGHPPTAEHKARHPGMHRTDTLDYVLVLSGQCTLVLDAADVELRQGDCIVQRATSHAWVNRSDAPCLLAVVLIDGKSPFAQECPAS